VFVECASLLKPLYAWVAGERFSGAAAEAVMYSSNEPTDVLVESVGGLSVMLEELKLRSGVGLELADTWGSVLVDEGSVVRLYESLVSAAGSGDVWAERVVGFMRDVVSVQRFGVDQGVPMKAGWDLRDDGFLVTNVVVLEPEVKCVLSRVRVDAGVMDRWRGLFAAWGAESVIGLHELELARATGSL